MNMVAKPLNTLRDDSLCLDRAVVEKINAGLR